MTPAELLLAMRGLLTLLPFLKKEYDTLTAKGEMTDDERASYQEMLTSFKSSPAWVEEPDPE